MSEQLLDKKRQVESYKSKEDDMEIDLMDVLRKTIVIRKCLYKAAGVGLIIGLIVAFSIPKQYTVNVTLSPEMGGTKSGNGIAGLAASFLGGSASTTDGSDALNASLSSDIVSSTPFLLELLDMEITTSKDVRLNLNTYLEEQSSPWWSYVIGFPGMAISGMKSLFVSEKEKSGISNINKEIIELTKNEADNLNILRKNIIASMDKKTAITTVTVTMQDPIATACVADSVVRKLQKYITNYRTSKAKEDCIYLQELYADRQKEYYMAQKNYASYIDSHDNLILQSVRTEQERLQNDMSLAYQVYSQVANQLQVARAKVQEEKPVFAIVEPAVVPLKPSGIGMKIYALAFMILCVISAAIIELKGKSFWNTLKNEVIS